MRRSVEMRENVKDPARRYQQLRAKKSSAQTYRDVSYCPVCAEDIFALSCVP